MSWAWSTEHRCKYDERGNKRTTVVNGWQTCAHNMTKGVTNGQTYETVDTHFRIRDGKDSWGGGQVSYKSNVVGTE